MEIKAISVEFAAALISAMQEMETIYRTEKNDHLKNRYADKSAVISVLMPPLLANKIALFVLPISGEGEFAGCIGASIVLRFGQEVWTIDPFYVKPIKDDPQTRLGALTYASRAALACFFPIPQEDDDGNAAAGRQKKEDSDAVLPEQYLKIARAQRRFALPVAFPSNKTEADKWIAEYTRRANEEKKAEEAAKQQEDSAGE